MSRKKKQHRPPLVIAFAVAIALFLTWQAWTAARNGLSDLYARPAINYLQDKRYVKYQVNDEEWKAIESNVVYANHLMPGNPQFLETLGWLQQIRLSEFADDLSIEQMDAHARAASSYFQAAAENRPTWPYYWGNLALEQYRRGNYAGDEFSLALENAARFGPWKNDTQRLVADLGTDAWEFITPQAKRQVILTIERGMDRQPDNMIQIVQSYGAWPGVCADSQTLFDITPPRVQSVCEQAQVAAKENQK